MNFSEVIGQEAVKERLIQMVKEDRLPHALLFCGPHGAGKMALAMAFACYLLAGDETKGESSPSVSMLVPCFATGNILTFISLILPSNYRA